QASCQSGACRVPVHSRRQQAHAWCGFPSETRALRARNFECTRSGSNGLRTLRHRGASETPIAWNWCVRKMLSCAMPSSAVILFAHGAREAEWARPIEQVRDRLRAEGLRVELAYLEIMRPSLDEAARILSEENVKRATIVPLFLGQGKHLRRELPEMIAALRRDHPGMSIRVTPALGDDPEILSAISDWVKRAAR